MKESKKSVLLRFIKSYFVPFTLIFIALQFFVFLSFYLSGKTLIWNYDGAYQHYPALSYYSGLLKNLSSGKGLPMMDFSIGLGFDVITTLSYYVLGDPLTLLSVFIPSSHLEFFYSFLIVLRMYLAGLSFGIFCFHKKKDVFPTMLGSLIYVFSSYALFAGLKHPFFLNPMIYLPLLILAVDRLLEKKKGLMLSAVCALCALSNFYFLYILTVLTVIYAFVRFFFVYQKDRLRCFIRIVGQGIAYYLLGIGISAVLLLPTVYAFLHNGRLDNTASMQSLLHYGYSYYRRLPQILFSFGTGSSSWTIVGIAVLAALCAVPALFIKKGWNTQRILFLLCAIGLMIPFIGKFMNGMSTVSNRWCFALTFLLAYFVADHYEELFAQNLFLKKLLLGFTLAYVLYAIFLGDRYVRIPTLLLVLILAVILFQERLHLPVQIRNRIILSLTLINLAISGNLLFGPYGSHFQDDFLAYGDIAPLTTSVAKDILGDVSTEFYRVQDTVTTSPNLALTQPMYGTSFYFSIMDNHVFDYMTGLENASMRFACQYFGFDRRAYLMSLNCVKYFITKTADNVPYGFTLQKQWEANDQTCYLYENQYALPLGVTYDSYLLRSDYDTLTSLEKQEAMMQCAVLDTDREDLQNKQPKYHIKKLNYKTSSDTIELSDSTMTVSATNSRLRLSFPSIKYSELYLHIDDFDITGSGRSRLYLRTMSKKRTFRNFTTFQAKTDNYYFGEDSVLFNLGYSPRSSHSAFLSIEQSGTYHLGSLDLYAQALSPLKRYYKERTAEPLQNVVIGTNQVTGTIALDRSKLLVLSIPYSTGWTAAIDGKKAELVCSNIMYTGLSVPAGDHTIELHYCTPYLKIGAMISLLSLGIFLFLFLFPKIRHAIHNK